MEVVLDDGEFWVDTGLLELADAQGYLDRRILLIYAGRGIQELVRVGSSTLIVKRREAPAQRYAAGRIGLNGFSPNRRVRPAQCSSLWLGGYVR